MRVDPYWTDMWARHSSERWALHSSLLRQVEAGARTPPASLTGNTQAAVDSILRSATDRSPYSLNTHVAFLGAVTGWRTLSAQQVAAFTGDPRLRQHLSHPGSLAFCAGLIEMTEPSEWAKNAAPGLGLYRPTTSERLEALRRQLTWAEWVGVTGGQPYGGGGHHDRHNVLAAELGLRLSEYANVVTVLGEPFSTPNLLTGDGVGRAHDTSMSRADLTVVRPDGMRIAVELTATTGPYFQAKVDRAVQLLAVSPMKLTGLTVIFLLAPNLDLSDSERKDIRRTAYAAVEKACRNEPGLSSDPTRFRIGVATWEEWFPGPHTASTGFFTMRADRPVAAGYFGRDTSWKAANFLDSSSVQFVPKDPDRMSAVIANSALLGQTPYWVRESVQNDPVHGTARLHLHGGPSELPVGGGTAWDTKLPSRIVGLGTSFARPGRLSENRQVKKPQAPPGLGSPSRQRSLALVGVAEGRSSVDHVIEQASLTRPRVRGKGTYENPLRRINLLQLLIAQPNVGQVSARTFLERVAAFAGTNADLSQEDLSWLVGGRSRGRRLAAWTEAERAQRVPPGFPYAH